MSKFFGSFSSLLFFLLIFFIITPLLIIQFTINKVTLNNLHKSIDEGLAYYGKIFTQLFKDECKRCEEEFYFVKKYLFKDGFYKKEEIGSYFFSSEKPFSRISLLDSTGACIFTLLSNPDQTYFTPKPYEEFRDLPPIDLNKIKYALDTTLIPLQLLPGRAGFAQRVIFALSKRQYLLAEINIQRLITNLTQKSNLPVNSFLLVYDKESNFLYHNPDVVPIDEANKIKYYIHSADYKIQKRIYRIQRFEIDSLPCLCTNLKNIYFTLGIDYSAMLSGITAGLNRGLLMTTGFGILVAVLFLFTGLYFKNSTDKILNRTKEIASGDFEKKVSIRFPIELHEIARNINVLSERLKILTREQIKSAKLSAIGKFAAHMVHDLRNPVYGMSLIAYELKNAFSPDDPRLRYFDEIINGIKKLGEIIERIAEHSRIYEPKLEKVDIEWLINEVIQEFKKSNPCEIIFKSEKVGILNIDPGQWRRVFLNLFQNSYEAKKEGCQITISANRSQHPLSSVYIEISDNCGGIPNEILEDIFEPFVTTKKKGLGLGLSFVKEIVEVHNGEIKIENNPGVGAKFIITLPAIIANETSEINAK